jgi:protein-S-isoprenylcysteine O-methyltransferase Ste14
VSKVIALRIINPLLILVFVVQGVTGIIFSMEIQVPNMLLLSKIHEYNGWLMIVLIVAHIALNWGWVKVNIFKIKPQPPKP